ncbi:hypothetical protein PSAB6_740003 [Paraburkholderia sabiae]|nr:hypothetical protein PSAB6_740003 [Paraburkholderia sabiae]
MARPRFAPWRTGWHAPDFALAGWHKPGHRRGHSC